MIGSELDLVSVIKVRIVMKEDKARTDRYRDFLEHSKTLLRIQERDFLWG